MLQLIIKKEIHNNLLNLRLLITTVISLVIIMSSIMVLTETYEAEWRDYVNRVRSQEEFIDNYGHSNRAGWMARQMRPPSPLNVFVVGIDREVDQYNFISNPVPVLFKNLDFIGIVTIIMSLVAILFSFNAISGEREAGVLRQMLSAGVARRTIIWGKFIGGSISVIVPFTIGVLGGLIYLILSARIQFRLIDYAVVLILVFVSWLYISGFYALGLFFSVRSRSTNQALLKSLFAWVVVVLVWPNVTPFIAAQIYRIPSASKIEQETSYLTSEERDEILQQRRKELLQTKFPGIVNLMQSERNEIENIIKGDTRLAQQYSAYTQAYDDLVQQVNHEQNGKADKIYEVFLEKSRRQENLATVLACISPSTNLLFISTNVTETGIKGEAHWRRQTSEYEGIFHNYVELQYQKAKESNPTFGYNDYLDLRGRPRFQYQPESLTERMGHGLTYSGVLVLFVIVCITGVFISFFRYDVR
jgi:ABC-type transport system involved in multi-copper enzyme maturation permease subunit